ncbi:MAG: DUF4041 domain-containing protein [Thermoanaerobaculia bacterium]
MPILTVVLLGIALAAIIALSSFLILTVRENRALTDRFRDVVDADAERKRVLDQLASEQRNARIAAQNAQDSAARQLDAMHRQMHESNNELASLESRIGALRSEFAALDEEANLRSFGFYKPHYNFSHSSEYDDALEEIRARQKAMLTDKTAAVSQGEWTVNGSKVEGAKQIRQTLKLMLRAFNGECDAAIARVRYNNIQVMEARIRKAHEMINSLAEVQRCTITNWYRDLKLEELRLVHEHEEKVQEEKEEQRRVREQMREDAIAERELEKARLDAEKEEERYERALAKARDEAAHAVGAQQAKLLADIEELNRRLAEAHTNKERAIARAQMTRSGHVYVISHLGSVGEHVYKVGMTRRLDPHDRIKELGDASVPFQFDVHAMIFTEDAPGLENKLHKAFHDRRVNRINEKKEFFRVSIDEIAGIVKQHHDAEITFTLAAEAAEYRKTMAMAQAGNA